MNIWRTIHPGLRCRPCFGCPLLCGYVARAFSMEDPPLKGQISIWFFFKKRSFYNFLIICDRIGWNVHLRLHPLRPWLLLQFRKSCFLISASIAVLGWVKNEPLNILWCFVGNLLTFRTCTAPLPFPQRLTCYALTPSWGVINIGVQHKEIVLMVQVFLLSWRNDLSSPTSTCSSEGSPDPPKRWREMVFLEGGEGE